jgi:endonuclease/exonuclease/phosphatase (EEP) superfamily protein YafD
MHKLRVVVDLLLAPPLLLLAAISGVGAIGAQGGRFSSNLDLLAQFAPIWLFAGTAALLGGLLLRGGLRWLVILGGLVGVAGSAVLIVPEFLRDTGPHAPADAPGQIKIVQFNVWSHNQDPEAVLRWIDAEDPDIAVIEETPPGLLKALKAHPRWRVACAQCDILMLSKAPALKATPAIQRRGHEVMAPLTHAVFADRRGRFDVIGVHNAWPTDADQAFQEERLAKLISTLPQDRTIVTGDFNSTPWSFARRRWDQAFGIPRRDRAVATWPARRYRRLQWLGAPFLAIDHVYAGPGWATVSVYRGRRLTSDHYPVVAVLAPVTPAPADRAPD